MCEMPRAQLIAWLDRELDESELASVAAHVGVCEQCGEQVRQMRAVSEIVDEYCVEVGRERRSPHWWAAAIAGAAAAIFIAAGLLWTRPARVPAPRPPIASTPQRALTSESRSKAVFEARRVSKQRRAIKPVVRAKPLPQQSLAALQVVIPLEEFLPIGAAPPGAVLVGNLTFDSGGLPHSLRLE